MKKLFLFLMACCLSLSMSARVAYLVPGNTNDKGQIPAQWDNHTFEHTAYDWFQETYVNTGVGDFINFTNIPTNTEEYAAIWIYIDREWKQSGEPWDEGRMDALFNNEVVNALKTYVQNGGNLFLGKQAARLAYRMGRIGYAPNYQCGGYSQDDRFWGIKAKLGSGLASENQRNRSDHAIYAGLATATMDGVEGCFPLLNSVGDAHSTDNNIHWVEYWTPDGNGGWHKNPDNNGDPALIEGWESHWSARALGTWTGIGDYCIIQAVEFMPKDAFTGTILTINIGAYQWNSESTGDAADNMRKLTKNALRYLNRPSRADLRIDNAFKTCGRVDCGSEDPLYNAFMILHPVVEGLNAQPYTTSFEGIEEANRAIVEQWNDNGTNRLAFTKAGQVKLQINLRESRTDHFWPAGDYAYEQLVDFAFSSAPQTVADADLSSNGLQGEEGKFMLLHPNMRGMDSLAYAISFDGIEEANRAEVVKIHDGEATRLGFTKAGQVKLVATLNSPAHNTIYGKGNHVVTKTITFAQPTFNWSQEPCHAAVNESKPNAQATCDVAGTTVKYESSNTAVASIDENTGHITYLSEGTADITAYILINDVKFSSAPFTVNVTEFLTYERTGLTPGRYGTICLERTSTALEGATFFWPAYKNVAEGEVAYIVLEEVNELQAGYGYFFLPTASTIRVSMSLTEEALEEPIDNGTATHGMHGNFTGTLDVPDYIEGLPNEYILSNNTLVYGTGNTIGEHRAYLKMSEVPTPEQAPAPVPGRKRVNMAVQQPPHTPTAVENMTETDGTTKTLINGQVVIRKNGVNYNVLGTKL